MNMKHPVLTMLRRRDVERETGLSRSTIYMRIAQRLWPKPVSLGPRAVGWPAGEVTALNAARIAGWPDAKIRKLVSDLETSRPLAMDLGSVSGDAVNSREETRHGDESGNG